MLTQRQQEIITGSLLGDGMIYSNYENNPSCKFQLTQSQLDHIGTSKKSYFMWWVSEFFELGCSVVPRETRTSGLIKKICGDKIHYQYVLTMRTSDIWKNLEKKWYVPINHHHYFKRRKIVPKDIILTPLTLCVWMMEDGSAYNKGNITLETQGFSIEEVDFLRDRLYKDLNIKSNIKKTKRADQHRIYVGSDCFRDFLNLIKPHVAWECFQYKINSDYEKIPQIGENHNQSKLKENEVREMIELRRQGKSVAELASIYKTSKGNVSIVTTGKNWSHIENPFEVKKKPRTTKEMKATIFRLRQQGLEQKDIAQQLNINQSTVSRTLQKGQI